MGASRTIDAVEVMTEKGLRPDPARFTFTRRHDVEERRVYDLAGTHGDKRLTGTFTVDSDGAPHEVSAQSVAVRRGGRSDGWWMYFSSDDSASIISAGGGGT